MKSTTPKKRGPSSRKSPGAKTSSEPKKLTFEAAVEEVFEKRREVLKKLAE